ncbi:hypothetical protein ACFL35_04540 [Candidatus Riflebacteria bacterium]
MKKIDDINVMSNVKIVLQNRLKILIDIARETGIIRLTDIKCLIGTDLINRVNLNVITRYLLDKGINVVFPPGELGIEEITREIGLIKKKRDFITQTELSNLLGNEHVSPFMDRVLEILNKINLEIVEDDYVETVILPKGLPYDEVCQKLVDIHLENGRLVADDIEKVLKRYPELPFSRETICFILSEYGIQLFDEKLALEKNELLDSLVELNGNKGYVLESYLVEFCKTERKVNIDEAIYHFLNKGLEVLTDKEYLKRRETVLKKIFIKTRAYLDDYGFFTEKYIERSTSILKKLDLSREDCLDYFKEMGLDLDKQKKALFLKKCS